MKSKKDQGTHHNVSVEHVFTTGACVLGQGTYGLGAAAARSASAQLMRNTKEQFWNNQEKVFKEWKQKEQERNSKLLAEQKKSTRVRLEEAMMQRDAEIRKMAVERKNFEREMKSEREQEAKQRNEELREQKQAAVQARQQAKQQLEQQRMREIAIARSQREEVLQLTAIEREQEMQAYQERGTRLRQLQEESRRRAKEEEQRRVEESAQAVQAMHKKQKKRQEAIEKLRKEIVELKTATVKSTRSSLQSDLERSLAQLEEEHANAASEVKKAQRARAEERQRAQSEQVEERKNYAHGLREELSESRKRYEDDRRKTLQQMQQSAKLQRDEARAIQEEEAALQREEHQEYIRTMRELAGKRAEENRARSISPPKGINSGRRDRQKKADGGEQ